MVNWVCLGAEAARAGPWRATIGRPHGLAIQVDVNAVRRAPRPFLPSELRPITDDAVRVGAAVHRCNVLRLDLASGHGDPHGSRRSNPAFRESRNRHRSAPFRETCTKSRPCFAAARDGLEDARAPGMPARPKAMLYLGAIADQERIVGIFRDLPPQILIAAERNHRLIGLLEVRIGGGN